MVKLKSKFSPVIAIALVVVMLISTAIPAFAAGTASVGSVAEDVNGETIVGQDVDQGQQTEYAYDIEVGDTSFDEECDVYATVPNSDIVVTVPKVQVLDGKAGASNSGVYKVEVRGDISADTVITVEPMDEMADRAGVNFEMSSAGKDNIPTDVDQEMTAFTYADGVRPDSPATTTGVVTAYGMTAGIWNGSFNFEINAGKETYQVAEENEERIFFALARRTPVADDVSNDVDVKYAGAQIAFFPRQNDEFSVRQVAGIKKEAFEAAFGTDGSNIVKAGFVYAVGTDISAPKMADVVNLVENGIEMDGYSEYQVTKISTTLVEGAYSWTCPIRDLTTDDLDKDLVAVPFIAWDTDGDGIEDSFAYGQSSQRVSFEYMYNRYYPVYAEMRGY